MVLKEYKSYKLKTNNKTVYLLLIDLRSNIKKIPFINIILMKKNLKLKYQNTRAINGNINQNKIFEPIISVRVLIKLPTRNF